jgi:hypothetical protein
LNPKNYHDDNNNNNIENNNAFTSTPPTTTSRKIRKNTATNASNCDDVNHNQHQLLSIPFNSTAAIITIQKSHHLMLIKMKL